MIVRRGRSVSQQGDRHVLTQSIALPKRRSVAREVEDRAMRRGDYGFNQDGLGLRNGGSSI